MAKIGDRVGAISHLEEDKVYFYGYGTYIGDKVPETEDVKFMGISLKTINRKNPCIKLDNGEEIYGCECWWGSENKVKDILSNYKEIITIDIDKQRKGLKE